MNKTDSCKESLSNDNMKHHQEVTPQRQVRCIPKSMGEDMDMMSCEQEKCKPNRSCVTSIARLLQSHTVTMETDSSQQEENSVEVSNENLPSVNQSLKRTSSSANCNTTLDVDETYYRPFKRKRKLIAANSQQRDEDKQEIDTTKESSDSIERENYNEQITTPVNNLQSQVEDVNVTGSVKNIPFLTSTPNDITCNNDIDSPIEDAVVSSTVYHYRRRRVLRREPAGAHMTVTGSDGTRVYLRLSDESKKQDKQGRPKRYQLLSVPFYQLRHEVEAEVCTAMYMFTMCV